MASIVKTYLAINEESIYGLKALSKGNTGVLQVAPLNLIF